MRRSKPSFTATTERSSAGPAEAGRRPTVALRSATESRHGGGRSMSTDAAVPPIAGVMDGALVAETDLKPGAIGFWGNMVQAVTHIAPGLNVLLGLTFIVSFAGVTAPIAYLLGGIICLGVAVVLTQLAKQFTGAGGYFLYISRTFGSLSRPVGARLGWITTWLYFLYDPVAVSSVCAFTGLLVQDTVKAQYDVKISW